MVRGSLDILHLLAQLLDQHLHVHRDAGHLQDGRFGAQRVGFAVQFLDQEVQPLANVTAFGAFVDVGVHQDGLVHISVLSDKFIKDPHEAVKAGDIVKVKVVEVDVVRKRIALSCRLNDTPVPAARAGRDDKPASRGNPPARNSQRTSAPTSAGQVGGTLGDLFRKAGVSR